MKDFIIRQATTEDKQYVLQIQDIDLDYLAEYYDHFMASPNTTSFVLIHSDKIIGFNVAFLINNGNTLVSRSGRVCKEYEGKGLYNYLDKYVIDWAQSMCIKSKITAMFLENPHESTASFQKNHKLLLTNGMINITFDPKKVDIQDGYIKEVEKLYVATDKDIASWIDAEDLYRYLFPDGYFVVDGIPYKLMSENIPIMTCPKPIIKFFSNLKIDKEFAVAFYLLGQWSLVIRKPAFCICENKDKR